MAREEIKDSKGKMIGAIEDRGKEILAFDKNGRPKARFDRHKNVTYDAGGTEVGKGNLVMKILMASVQETSQHAKSSFTARSAAQKQAAAEKQGAARGAQPRPSGGGPRGRSG